MSSIFKHIQTAFQKIARSALKNKGCYLSADEVSAISMHHAIPDAIGDYDEWEFDAEDNLIEKI